MESAFISNLVGRSVTIPYCTCCSVGYCQKRKGEIVAVYMSSEERSLSYVVALDDGEILDDPPGIRLSD